MNRYFSDIKNGSGLFWDWYVVFGSFTIMIVSYGVRYSFGVFVKPMMVEYNWPMTIIQLGSSINLVMYAIAGVITGWLLDRFAPRWSATRCRIVECIQVFTLNTRHVPAGSYAGGFATRCVVGAKPRGQRTE